MAANGRNGICAGERPMSTLANACHLCLPSWRPRRPLESCRPLTCTDAVRAGFATPRIAAQQGAAMNDVHVVFGTGAIGLALIDELAGRGLPVRAVNRSGSADVLSDVEVRGGDVSDGDFAVRAAAGAAVVYQCLNPAYHRWAEDFPPLQDSVVHAARAVASQRRVGLGTRPPGPVSGPSSAGQGSAPPLRALDPLTPTQQRPLWAGRPRVAEGVPISYELCCYFKSRAPPAPAAIPARCLSDQRAMMPRTTPAIASSTESAAKAKPSVRRPLSASPGSMTSSPGNNFSRSGLNTKKPPIGPRSADRITAVARSFPAPR